LREFAGRRTSLTGTHRVAVVLDHEDDRQFPQRGEIVSLVYGALVDRTITHERHRGTFQAAVLERVGESGPERDLTADDAVATQKLRDGSK
jgi:hypothetical protein